MAIDRTLRERPVPPKLLPGRLWYVNAYAVSSRYGGPEEGGWWYNVFKPLGSIPVWYPNFEFTDTNAVVCINVDAVEDEIGRVTEAAKEQLYSLFYAEFAGQRHRSSVIGEADLMIVVEEHFAEHEPKAKPHYE